MNAPALNLDFVELESMDAPDDGWDWFRGFSVGVAAGAIALSLT
ncbi:MpaA2 family daptide-type RiPP [Arthrobacter sp. RAF14]